VVRSTTGTAIGRLHSELELAAVRIAPSTTTPTSALVPPMSRVITLVQPDASGEVLPAIRPPARPESTKLTA
jgi:hypothetical protein